MIQSFLSPIFQQGVLTNFSNIPHPSQNKDGYFVFDLKLKESMHQYYGVKERFEYRLDDRNLFIHQLADTIRSFVQGYDNIYIPQSSSNFLTWLMDSLNTSYTVIPKNNLDNVYLFSELLPLQKKERIAHLQRLDEMKQSGDVFKINLMKANQRRYYHPVIFDKVENKPGRNLVIDDSCFSGTTLEGIKSVLPNFDFLAIFSKNSD